MDQPGTYTISSSMANKDQDPASAPKSSMDGRRPCCSLRNVITFLVVIGLGSFFAFLAGGSDGVVVVAIMWSVGLPLVYLILRRDTIMLALLLLLLLAVVMER